MIELVTSMMVSWTGFAAAEVSLNYRASISILQSSYEVHFLKRFSWFNDRQLRASSSSNCHTTAVSSDHYKKQQKKNTSCPQSSVSIPIEILMRY